MQAYLHAWRKAYKKNISIDFSSSFPSSNGWNMAK
jgi:hypothetical protein